jgi:hypothetical protein
MFLPRVNGVDYINLEDSCQKTQYFMFQCTPASFKRSLAQMKVFDLIKSVQHNRI